MRPESLTFIAPPLLTLVVLGLFTLACSRPSAPDAPQPPVAKVVPEELVEHGHLRTDDYYWMKERENPEVVAYLEAENAYTGAVLKHTEPLQEKLYDEIVGRIKKDDASVPFKHGDYLYYRRFAGDGEYPLHCRKRGSVEAAEEVLLDVNQLAEGHGYFAARGLEVSAEQNLLAYATDSVGRRFYTLRFKNLDTGEILDDTIPGITANSAWANDNRTILYVKQHPETLRWYQVYRHVLGSDPAADELVYEEADETFSVFVFKTKSERFLMIGSTQTLATEFRYLPADDPTAEPRVIEPRKRDHEYSVGHLGDHFYIRTNDRAKNFRLMKATVAAPGRENWQEVVPHRDDVLLEGVELFRHHLVLSERKGGLNQLQVLPWSGGEAHYLDFGEPAYDASPSDNAELDTQVLRFRYSSLTTPWSTYDYDMETREKTLLKQDEVLGDFDAADYVTERLHAPARDGKEIPLSVVYRQGTERDGSHPLLLYGYGSYGSNVDATFRSARLSLLDRGFVFAIAHIRGSETLGREWYEDGKLLKKKNTFTDFIDAAEHLISEGYTQSDRLFAEGRSAGGLLMGAVYNLRPDLWKGVLAGVPFVDVVTTMLEPDIPLTSGEWDEWGDPRKKEYYDYMLSYSPYDNVEAADYTNMLVTTGLHDSQVQYWEPAKWVAKLRARKTDDNWVLLHTNMDAGHGGASGRFRRYKVTSMEYAFLLDLVGIGE